MLSWNIRKNWKYVPDHVLTCIYKTFFKEGPGQCQANRPVPVGFKFFYYSFWWYWVGGTGSCITQSIGSIFVQPIIIIRAELTFETLIFLVYALQTWAFTTKRNLEYEEIYIFELWRILNSLLDIFKCYKQQKISSRIKEETKRSTYCLFKSVHLFQWETAKRLLIS